MSSHILARFNRHELEEQQAEVLREVIGEPADTQPMPADHRKTADYLDPTDAHRRQARGVPVQTMGVSGVIRGTQPAVEALRLDGLRRRRA